MSKRRLVLSVQGRESPRQGPRATVQPRAAWRRGRGRAEQTGLASHLTPLLLPPAATAGSYQPATRSTGNNGGRQEPRHPLPPQQEVPAMSSGPGLQGQLPAQRKQWGAGGQQPGPSWCPSSSLCAPQVAPSRGSPTFGCYFLIVVGGRQKEGAVPRALGNQDTWVLVSTSSLWAAVPHYLFSLIS